MIPKASEEDISVKMVTVQTSVFSTSETERCASSAPKCLLDAYTLNKKMPEDLYYLINLIFLKEISSNANFSLSEKINLYPNIDATEVWVPFETRSGSRFKFQGWSLTLK